MTRQRQKKAAAKRTRPTLRDVAEVVGVSVNTVSTVLNDRPRAQDYAQETRERIRVAAKELGYIPNPLAQVLKKSRTNMLGVVMFFQQSNFYASTLQAVEDVAQSKGFEIVSADMGRDLGRFEQCIHLLTAWRVEGIVAAIGGHAVDREILETVQNGGTPVVIVGADFPEERTPLRIHGQLWRRSSDCRPPLGTGAYPCRRIGRKPGKQHLRKPAGRHPFRFRRAWLPFNRKTDSTFKKHQVRIGHRLQKRWTDAH